MQAVTTIGLDIAKSVFQIDPEQTLMRTKCAVVGRKATP
jgi:hypothetical protein